MRLVSKTSLVLVSLVCATASVRGAELLRLTNGFSMECDHHAVIDGRVRVFTDPDSYIELRPEEVQSFETLPNAPKPAILPAESPKLAPTDVRQILASAGEQHNVDVDLLASVVKAESGGNARAVSRTGARGLMQLMPGTADQMGVEDSFKPEQNVRGGSAYLDSLLTRYRDNLALALAAYNAGPAAVDKYHGIPPYRETKLYVVRVIHEFNRRVRERERLATMAGVRVQRTETSR